jgi:hypothetical protein
MAALVLKVLAGNLQQGKQRIQLQTIKSAELQTEDKLKKLAGSAGWGFTGAIVGGLLTGGIGLAVGGLAGILSGGNKTEVCFSCELEDGRKFLAVTSKENWQKILAATFGKDQSQLTPVQLSSENLNENQNEAQSNELESTQAPSTQPIHEVEIDEARTYIESILSKFDVKIQINQAREQLTIVINRETSYQVDYLKLSRDLESEITALERKGIRFRGVDKIKVIGRIIGNAKPEWQKILYSEESLSSNTKSSSTTKSTDKVSSDIKDKVVVILGHFWKWYISGFASRPEKALYESPRFYRILLTLMFLSLISSFFPNTSVKSTSSISSNQLNSNELTDRDICIASIDEAEEKSFKLKGEEAAEYITKLHKLLIDINVNGSRFIDICKQNVSKEQLMRLDTAVKRLEANL